MKLASIYRSIANIIYFTSITTLLLVYCNEYADGTIETTLNTLQLFGYSLS